MLDFSRFEWVSFDCYGTLEDWETGISAAVSRVLESRGIDMSRGVIHVSEQKGICALNSERLMPMGSRQEATTSAGGLAAACCLSS